ncbi:uncharacterized protein LOC121851249 [Callorhinchus milii]|uniref:uncharacterized protein LOC121851249 n=1 Tax=Callorhinchus milii TaxID=7868 RepID=UPI001C3F5E64|nr:uncharacterized protein LOC121851249 [Callorhinchus milii]
MAAERRQDLPLTSSGVGLRYTPARYFPPSDFRALVRDPLRSDLRVVDKISSFDEVFNHFETTTGSTHNNKTLHSVLDHPKHKKGATLVKVHYIKDLSEKLKARSWGSPLAMGNQTSEMKDKFAGQLPQSMHTAFEGGPQPFGLANHHTNGPSKNIIASTENPRRAGEEFYVNDKDVLRLNEPYMSVTTKDFRPYKRYLSFVCSHADRFQYPFTDHFAPAKDLEGVAKKDIATYWQTEDYPKAWGHGLKENPLPKDSQRILRETWPMRDAMQFPNPTRLTRLPARLVPVPNFGLRTLCQDSYQPPRDVKHRQDVMCPLSAPWVLPLEGPVPEIMSTPKMYESEYQTYGSGYPVTV